MPLLSPRRRTAWARLAGIALAGAAAVLLCGAAAPYDEALSALGRRDYALAISLFREAADAGQPAAAYNLGRIYDQGLGVPRNPTMALIWFRKAAEAGNPGAQYHLGLMYQKGQGAPRDEARAAAWYEKAASQGYSDAQKHLGAMYALGRGVPQDDAEAARWFGESASHGDADAALYLALLRAQAPGREPPGTMTQVRFREVMNDVFGEGRWRETGGYRTPAVENRLRSEGALTVARGETSRHSLGTPQAPGAYDMVVRGLTPIEAAARLRHSGVAFRRLYPEGLHGDQGAHLHVEPVAKATPPPTPAEAEALAAQRQAAQRTADVLLERAAARGDICARRALDSGATPNARPAPTLSKLIRSGSCG